ncbi:ribonuclease HepT family protein [Pontiella sulfatireligans]|uniref:Uncharacterized protein n=1 Tax=Pontiella sulfatireligans TaxID=2750658 RepID=A0A6C2UT90_9BACT|nr:hypothetical protein [Pontiella sulfatireligans]VGO23183.1 hypothetical protein SCARR_05288 [Pontiella sulfatireligans]
MTTNERKTFEVNTRLAGLKVDFPALWSDFEKVVANSVNTTLKNRMHATGCAARFGRLEKAIQALTEKDRNDLLNYAGQKTRSRETIDAVHMALQIIEEAARSLSESARNEKGRPAVNEWPTEAACYLFRKHVQEKFKVPSTGGLCSDFCQMFLKALGQPSYIGLKQRLEAIRKQSKDEREFARAFVEDILSM